MTALNPADIQSGLEAHGVPSTAAQQFTAITARESGHDPGRICYAPGSDSSQCTQYRKPGDTQGAFGLFQFLNSTWNGYQCTPAAPSDPLAPNLAALNAGNSIACAATAFKKNGFADWGGAPAAVAGAVGGAASAVGSAANSAAQGVCNAPVIGGIIQGTPGGAAFCGGQAVAGSAAAGTLGPNVKSLSQRTLAVIAGAVLVLVGIMAIFKVAPVPVPV